jgi:hypothetical protein
MISSKLEFDTNYMQMTSKFYQIKIQSILLWSLTLVLCSLFTKNSNAQGNLLLLQKRVVFEGTKRILKVEYANTGQDNAKYVVSLLNMMMKEDGSFQELSKSDTSEWFADKYVRIFPRIIILAPKETQTMKIQLINTQNMKPGEYRSHLYFRAVPDLDKVDKKKKTDSTQKTVSVSIKAVFGITIPLIIRVGESNTKVEITDLTFVQPNDTTNTLKFTFRRTGNFSVYGDIKATYISPGGDETVVGNIKGVAVYTPGTIRYSSMNLKNNKKINYHTGKIRLTYAMQAEEKGTIMAEKEVLLR